MRAREEHLQVRRTARYWILGGRGARELWYVLHGYRQLAGRFLRRFERLAGAERTIVAPEALNRFYVEEGWGRHGPESVVGATWMTREDRLAEIDDYVAYLDALHARVGPEAPDARVTVLGFSQGVATAARWAVLGSIRPARLVLWGDTLPPDLDMEAAAAALEGVELSLVRGDADPAIDEARAAAEAERLAAAGIAHRVLEYVGGHYVESTTLRRLAAEGVPDP